MDSVQVQQDQLSDAGPKIWNDILGWNQEQLDDLRLVGYSYLKEGKYDIALPIFESLAILLPASVYDLQTLGALYLEVGKNVQALQAIEQALKIDPHHPPTLLNRTKAFFSLGYRRQAIAQAKDLERIQNPVISGQATALILAYTPA